MHLDVITGVLNAEQADPPEAVTSFVISTETCEGFDANNAVVTLDAPARATLIAQIDAVAAVQGTMPAAYGLLFDDARPTFLSWTWDEMDPLQELAQASSLAAEASILPGRADLAGYVPREMHSCRLEVAAAGVRRSAWRGQRTTSRRARSRSPHSATSSRASRARCARTSHVAFDREHSGASDVALHDRLAVSGHWSPFEHSAKALTESARVANFRGWAQYRTHFADETRGIDLVQLAAARRAARRASTRPA